MSETDFLPRILCVDDNPTMLQTLAVGFAMYDFEVVTAEHGNDALTQFHAHGGSFVAILTDNDLCR